MKEGDMVAWKTINGERRGRVERPATIPGYYIVTMQDGKGTVAHARSLRIIETTTTTK